MKRSLCPLSFHPQPAPHSVTDTERSLNRIGTRELLRAGGTCARTARTGARGSARRAAGQGAGQGARRAARRGGRPRRGRRPSARRCGPVLDHGARTTTPSRTSPPSASPTSTPTSRFHSIQCLPRLISPEFSSI